VKVWNRLELEIEGKPAPGGSKTAFGFKDKLDKIHARIVDAGKGNLDWKNLCKFEASRQYTGEPIRGTAVWAHFVFTMPRNKSHFFRGARANVLRPNAPCFHLVKPDTTKLIRSTEDALTGVIWGDDAIVFPSGIKIYDGRPGVKITVRWVSQEPA